MRPRSFSQIRVSVSSVLVVRVRLGCGRFSSREAPGGSSPVHIQQYAGKVGGNPPLGRSFAPPRWLPRPARLALPHRRWRRTDDAVRILNGLFISLLLIHVLSDRSY